jgi:hypothetical protein
MWTIRPCSLIRRTCDGITALFDPHRKGMERCLHNPCIKGWIKGWNKGWRKGWSKLQVPPMRRKRAALWLRRQIVGDHEGMIQFKRCRRAISFSASGSPLSVQSSRELIPQCFSTLSVKANSFSMFCWMCFAMVFRVKGLLAASS